MAYLGNAPARSFISFERQVFTIVNSQTAYTLSHSVTNENDIRLVINNIVQEPGSGKAYTASGTTLTLSAALTNGTDEMYCVFLGRATATNAPSAGSVGTSQLAADAVTEAKIADDAVESEHLNDNVISGQTELAVAPASTDELLISDGGTLKRIDVSLVGGDNTPAFLAYKSSSQAVPDATKTKIVIDTEILDSDSAFASSRFTVPTGEGGYYHITGKCAITEDSGEASEVELNLYKNGAQYTKNYFYSGGVGSGFGTFETWGLTISAMVSLSAGDYVELYAYINETSGNSGSVSTGLQNTLFGGYKLIGL